MPIVVLHLRWDHLTADQRDTARGRLEGLERRDPSGPCYSSTCRLAGEAVLATVVWAGEESARAFWRDLTVRRPGEPALPQPHAAAFGVPDVFAAGYRRAAPVVPAPRTAAEASAVAGVGQPRSL